MVVLAVKERFRDVWVAATVPSKIKLKLLKDAQYVMCADLQELLSAHPPGQKQSLTLRLYGTLLKGFAVLHLKRTLQLGSDCEQTIARFDESTRHPHFLQGARDPALVTLDASLADLELAVEVQLPELPDLLLVRSQSPPRALEDAHAFQRDEFGPTPGGSLPLAEPDAPTSPLPSAPVATPPSATPRTPARKRRARPGLDPILEVPGYMDWQDAPVVAAPTPTVPVLEERFALPDLFAQPELPVKRPRVDPGPTEPLRGDDRVPDLGIPELPDLADIMAPSAERDGTPLGVPELTGFPTGSDLSPLVPEPLVDLEAIPMDGSLSLESIASQSQGDERQYGVKAFALSKYLDGFSTDVAFTELVPRRHKSSVAAQTFFQLLVLAAHGDCTLAQREAYDTITVTRTRKS